MEENKVGGRGTYGSWCECDCVCLRGVGESDGKEKKNKESEQGQGGGNINKKSLNLHKHNSQGKCLMLAPCSLILPFTKDNQSITLLPLPVHTQ